MKRLLLGIAAAFLIAGCGEATGAGGGATPTAVVQTPTPSTATTAPTAKPAAKPTAHPTARPTARATAKATPPPANTCGAPANPWGYNFCGGGYIYAVPTSFCAYFNCIPSFWASTKGYAEQCVDGMFSHSGGRSGACSYHGGERRPLYA